MNCKKCYEDPCICGAVYRSWSLKRLRDVLSQLIKELVRRAEHGK